MADDGQTSYSCKCLNVRIHPLPPPGPPEEIADADFLLVYVGEEGLSIVHPQLTLRSKGPRLDRTHESSRQSVRYVALTCLVCQTLVYRVVQAVSPDVENGEGPILPSEDWAENEVLKSTTGWVEVSKQCLSGKPIPEAEASPLYSGTFRIILPSGVSSAPLATPLYTVPSPSPPHSPSEAPRTILPPLPALFAPPPFTPAHPVFAHLSAAATSESEKIRASAEEELKRLVAQKIDEIKSSEEKLKQEVELLWITFKGAVDKYEDELNPSRRIPTSRRRSGSKSGSYSGLNGTATSVRVVDFLPGIVPPSRTLSPSFVASHAPSALSASLATSSIHQAMAQAQARSDQQTDSSRRSRRSASPAHSADGSSATRAVSPSTASTRTLGLPTNGEAEIREAYRRNMNESLDVATSFKYMMDLDAHMKASGIATQPDIPEENELPSPPSPGASTAIRGRSPRAGKSAIKKPAKSRDSTPQKVQGSPIHPAVEGEAPKEETTPKGKRKVTFDVKPDVAIISNEESSSAETTPTPPRDEEPVFDMDNEIIGESTDMVAPIWLPLNQPTASVQDFTFARRPSRHRPVSMSGLPSSLSTLRPASLPLPSAMPVRALSPSQPVDERSRAQSVRETLLSGFTEEGKRFITGEIREEQEPAEEVNEREAEILKLVAASMPSHRSAWKRNSSAWQTFVNRRRTSELAKAAASEDDDTSNGESAAYYDESEDESEEEPKEHWSNANLSKSLPIPIGPLGSKKAVGMPSVQPKASLPTSDRPAAPPPVDKVSAAALRRASYAERDRNRLLDPGALDFAGEDDDDEDDEDAVEGDDNNSKSRQFALKILQKRSKIPADGLWRSLA